MYILHIDMKRLLRVILTFCLCLSVCGCASSEEASSSWKMATASLYNFPWGCTVEQAEEMLVLTSDRVSDPEMRSTEPGRYRMYHRYALDETYPFAFDYLKLEEQYYIDAEGKEYPIGVTAVMLGYAEGILEIVDGEILPSQMTEEQQAYRDDFLAEQIEKGTELYTFSVTDGKGQEQIYYGYGDWSKEDVKDLGFLRSMVGEVDLTALSADALQQQYPLSTASERRMGVEFIGMWRAFLDAGLPETDNSKS